MAASTVDLQKMKNVSSELSNIYTTMTNNKKKLDELMARLPKVWQGEGASAYQNAYAHNAQNFVLLAEAIRSCSQTLSAVSTTYSKADMAAAEAIKAKMAKG